MRKIFLFLCAALLSLIASATDYDVVINDALIYPKSEGGGDIDITSQLGGALLKDGDNVNITIKGYFSVAVDNISYVGIVDNSEAASYWTPLSDMNYSGTSLSVAVSEGTECDVSVTIPIMADAVSNEKVIIRLMLELSSSVKRKLGNDPVKLRATQDELNAVAAEYSVDMPTGEFAADGESQFKMEIDFETSEVIKKDDILKLNVSGTFDAAIYHATMMVFEGSKEMLSWTPVTFTASKDAELSNVEIPVTMTNSFSGKTGKIILFAVFNEGEEVPSGISFLKAGEEVHEGIELGPKSYETVSLDYNQYAEPHNYQFIDAAIATNVLPNDFVTFSISGVTNKAFEGELKVYLRDGVEGGSYGAISAYTTIATKVDAQGEITFEGTLKATKVAEICDLVMEISDEAEEGASIVIAPAGTQVHEGVELAPKNFTTLVLTKNEWNEGANSNYQYEEELTAPAEGFQKADYVSLSISGVASHAFEKLQVALIDDEYQAHSAYETIAENVAEGDKINFTKKIVLTSDATVCKLSITTTDAAFDGVDEITIGAGSQQSDKADYTALNAAIAEAEGLTEGDYTAESWSALQTALTDAKAVDTELDAENQSTVDDATSALQSAISALEKNSGSNEGVELASKEFTTLVLNKNVWADGSNYQYAEELTAPAEGFQEGDYVSFSISGVASHAITGLQVALIDGNWQAVSDYVIIAENIEENGEVSVVAGKIALTKAAEVCKLTITTTDAVFEGVDEITIATGDAPEVNPVFTLTMPSTVFEAQHDDKENPDKITGYVAKIEMNVEDLMLKTDDIVALVFDGSFNVPVTGISPAIIDASEATNYWGEISDWGWIQLDAEANALINKTAKIKITKDAQSTTIVACVPVKGGNGEEKINFTKTGDPTAVKSVASNAFSIIGGMVYSAGEIVVYNVAGKVVATASQSFNVNSLAAGVYFIAAQEGTIKFVK